MFSRIEIPQPSAVQLEGKPLEYYENRVGAAGDTTDSSFPITGSGEVIQAAITPVVEAVKPAAKRVMTTILGTERTIEEPRSVSAKLNLEIDETIETPVDNIKPATKQKDDAEKHKPSYESFDHGTAQVLVDFSIADDERPASNDVLGPVVRVLLENHGSAPIELIAEKTGQSEEFIRGHGLILPGVFEYSIDLHTNQEILSVPPLANQTYATNEDGRTVVVPVTESDISTAAD